MGRVVNFILNDERESKEKILVSTADSKPNGRCKRDLTLAGPCKGTCNKT